MEERAQLSGQCEQQDSSAHVFVLQSIPVASARQVWVDSSREGSMSAGQMSIMPAGLPMLWEWQGPVQALHVSVNPRVADLLAADRLGRSYVEVPALCLFDDRFVRHLLELLRMEAVAGAEPLRSQHLIQRLLLRVGIGSRRTMKPPTGALRPDGVRAVTDWIEENLADPISVIDLAALAGVEASWFTRLFSRAVGCSPYRYVLERRVLRAQIALRSGMSVAATASLCGFADQAHLSRHFRRQVGATPAAWARISRN
ncbi:AraC family transcriptional regulator [Mycobacterium avium]|uniref:AraC family transcriptional regulator n=1 Tax=Mycobacterium avium TaxID=1764 RepID=UPI00111BD48D|nr:AraC family transcriptional regulator [Mycobacterium avium]